MLTLRQPAQESPASHNPYNSYWLPFTPVRLSPPRFSGWVYLLVRQTQFKVCTLLVWLRPEGVAISTGAIPAVFTLKNAYPTPILTMFDYSSHNIYSTNRIGLYPIDLLLIYPLSFPIFIKASATLSAPILRESMFQGIMSPTVRTWWTFTVIRLYTLNLMLCWTVTALRTSPSDSTVTDQSAFTSWTWGRFHSSSMSPSSTTRQATAFCNIHPRVS